MMSKAAKKAAKMRAENKASIKRWLEVDRPAHLRTVEIANHGLTVIPVRVRFVSPNQSGLKLHKGSQFGTLLKVLGTGLSWKVWADGYARPSEYHASFWEIV